MRHCTWLLPLLAGCGLFGSYDGDAPRGRFDAFEANTESYVLVTDAGLPAPWLLTSTDLPGEDGCALGEDLAVEPLEAASRLMWIGQTLVDDTAVPEPGMDHCPVGVHDEAGDCGANGLEQEGLLSCAVFQQWNRSGDMTDLQYSTGGQVTVTEEGDTCRAQVALEFGGDLWEQEFAWSDETCVHPAR